MNREPRNLQYTVRSVPPSLDKVIRSRCKREHKSLNETLLEVLRLGIGLKEERTFHDLDSFFGSWIEDPSVDLALREQRKHAFF